MRRVLQDLGWEAYWYVGECIDIMMRIITELIPTPLDAPERRIFNTYLLRQSWLSDLPFVLLAERYGFVRSVMADIAESPIGDYHIPVFHRLLAYYGEMA